MMPAPQEATLESRLPIAQPQRFVSVEKWTEEAAFSYCQWITRNHYENFPVGSILIPKRIRKYVCAVYAFARTADDFADEPEYQSNRMELLDTWLEATQTVEERPINHPVFIALRSTLRDCQVPRQLFEDLILAFKMDVEKSTYNNFDEVLHYCKHSANPVGRIILHLFGYSDSKRMELSDQICTGLQLANFWQDVSVDLKKPRVYLPEDEISRFGYSTKALHDGELNHAFIELLKFQVDRTQAIFDAGKPLIAMLSGRLKFEIYLTWLGGCRVLEKIRALDYKVLAHRPTVNKFDWAKLGIKALFGSTQ